MCPHQSTSGQGKGTWMEVRDLGTLRGDLYCFLQALQHNTFRFQKPLYLPLREEGLRENRGALELLSISRYGWDENTGPTVPTEFTILRKSVLKVASDKSWPMPSFCICDKWGTESVNTLPKGTQWVQRGLGHNLKSQSRAREARPVPQSRKIVTWASTPQTVLNQAHAVSLTSDQFILYL